MQSVWERRLQQWKGKLLRPRPSKDKKVCKGQCQSKRNNRKTMEVIDSDDSRLCRTSGFRCSISPVNGNIATVLPLNSWSTSNLLFWKVQGMPLFPGKSRHSTALQHIHNKLGNLNASKMSLHHKRQQVDHFLTARLYTSSKQLMTSIMSIGGGRSLLSATSQCNDFVVTFFFFFFK